LTIFSAQAIRSTTDWRSGSATRAERANCSVAGARCFMAQGGRILRRSRFMTSLSRRAFLASPLVFSPWVARAQGAVSDQLIGSLLICGFNGTSASAAGAQALARHVEAGRAGGVCFLGHNTRNRAGIEGLTRLFASASKRGKALISVDQEGGAEQRLGKRSGYEALPAAQAVAARRSAEEARRIYSGMARQLRAAGFNFNLAPVVDLGFEPRNPIIAKWGRAYGNDGASVARFAGAFAQGHRDQRVLTALKHFPGHGSTLLDSHDRPVDITSTFKPDELTPFRDLARRGLIDVVMSGHLTHARLTGGAPATLSPQAVALLRNDIGFGGVIMTDDLDMKAIRSAYDLYDAIVRSVAAGYDLILLSNSLKPDDNMPARAIAAIRNAVAAGRIRPAQIEAAAARVTQLQGRI